ncbi:MAG TPA: mandelate racemase/muconate lactonizing enzyme family protein [Burkholderiales bacterium]|nr:mandelate racemase/muconate lactonizing enzyme family protein [Burkholderiales bacterium]
MISEGRHFLTAMLKEKVLPFFAGRDARDLETLVDEVYAWKSNYKYAGPALWTTVAWAEAALFDLLGKAAGKSIADLLGGRRRDCVPVYVSSLLRETTAEEEVEWVGRRIEQTRAKAVKLKIGGRLSRNADVSPGRSERLIALARKTWGDAMKIYVDANGSYDAPHALEVAKMLKAHGVVFFEEPCPFEDLDETRAVADALDMPVAGGEQDASLPRFEYMARNRVVDILQPDMLYNGGFIRNHRVSVIARHYGLPLTPHSPYLGPRQALTTHYCATLPELPIEMEYAAALPERPMDWYRPQIEAKNGLVAVPTGPGLGIELAPEVVNGLKIVD